MNKLFKLTAVVLLVLLLCLAVGCKGKDYIDNSSVINDMPTMPPNSAGTDADENQSGSDGAQQGMDNIMDITDLLNPDKYNEEQSKNQGSNSKPTTGSSSSSDSSSTTSSKPSSSSSSQSSIQSNSSVENDMATGTEKDTASYTTSGWIL